MSSLFKRLVPQISVYRTEGGSPCNLWRLGAANERVLQCTRNDDELGKWIAVRCSDV